VGDVGEGAHLGGDDLIAEGEEQEVDQSRALPLHIPAKKRIERQRARARERERERERLCMCVFVCVCVCV